MSMADSSPATMNEDPAPLYFDSYAIVGPRGRKDFRELCRTEDLLAEPKPVACGVQPVGRTLRPVSLRRNMIEDIRQSASDPSSTALSSGTSSLHASAPMPDSPQHIIFQLKW